MKGNSVKIGLVVTLTLLLSTPVSWEPDRYPSLISNAWGLSTGNGTLGTDIFVQIAKTKNPAVVNVSTKAKRQSPNNFRSPENVPDPFRDFYDRFFGERENQPQRPKRGMGSGFIIEPDGHILTNNHVIEGADEILVTLEENGTEKEYTAEIVGTDPKTDIALIKIIPDQDAPRTFTSLNLGNSDNLEVGEWVVAIGNPFGLSHTVTVGVVSAKGRSIGSGPYDEYIQTDASINPGNSGGPLLNIKGEVIGINTAIIAGNTGGNVGIGFAIPINMAKSILADLKEKGSVTRGWLGVMIQKITPELAQSFNLSQSEGALVGDVIPNSPSSAAGIKRGDVIVSFDGNPVKEMETLPKMVAAVTPGSEVDVVVIRDGKKKTIPVTIAVLKDDMAKAKKEVDLLGLQVQDITPELAETLQLEEKSGVLVSEVTPGGPSGEAGIRRGDVITEMNRKPVNNLASYQALAKNVESGKTVLFLIKRGGSTIYVAVKIK